MSFHEHLLPPNALPFEQALSAALDRTFDVPVPIEDIFRSSVCPAPLLPWLAWHVSVDLWDEEWPDEKKRAMIRESIELHRRKGTLYGITRYLSYAGTPLRRAIVPPDKAFAGQTMTLLERQDWLNRFPQIRVFQFRDNGTSTYGAFTRGANKLPRTFLGAGPSASPPASGVHAIGTTFPYKTTAAERWGRRAFLWDKGPHFRSSGLETPLRWIERTKTVQQETSYDYEQVLIPGAGAGAVFLGKTVKGNLTGKDGRMFPVANEAQARIVSVALKRDTMTADNALALRAAVLPSLDPINVFPEVVAEEGLSMLGFNVFGGLAGRWLDPKTKERKRIRGFVQGFLPETTANLRLYDRIFLHDKTRLPAGRPRSRYLGSMRLGMPAYNAVLSVEIRGQRTVYETQRFVSGHLSAASQKPLEFAKTAVQRAKSKRDKILLRTALHRPITSSDGYSTRDGITTRDLILRP